MNETQRSRLAAAVHGLTQCGNCPIKSTGDQPLNLSGRTAVIRILHDLIAALFPGCHGCDPARGDELVRHIEQTVLAISDDLCEIVTHAFEYECTIKECEDCDKCGERAAEVVADIIDALPEIQRILALDIQAAYEGDPAAQSTMEVVMSYPGVQAVIVHRIAHVLYEHHVPLIPRIMSEHAHSETGIDIHPGATIGPGFFIDHGTGVVIGETCVIGRNVKLYQGVTLGALSFEKDEDGNLVKGIKRHPNVEDGVVIYAGATILGGETTIGAHSVIGGNVWLTHSVPPGCKVHNQQPRPLIKQQDGSWKTANGPWEDHGAGI